MSNLFDFSEYLRELTPAEERQLTLLKFAEEEARKARLAFEDTLLKQPLTPEARDEIWAKAAPGIYGVACGDGQDEERVDREYNDELSDWDFLMTLNGNGYYGE